MFEINIIRIRPVSEICAGVPKAQHARAGDLADVLSLVECILATLHP